MRMLVLLLILCAILAAQSGGGAETRFSFSLADEAAQATGLRLPAPDTQNALLAGMSFTWRKPEHWVFQTSLAWVTASDGTTHSTLRTREAFAGVWLSDFELTAGKRILRWSTGYAFTPAGVLDPVRDPSDPTDRLNLNEGREMATADWIHGKHAVTVVWASGGLLDSHRPGMRETTAVRYNVMVEGFDTSFIVAKDRGRDLFTGINFTRVIGEAIEIHGELVHRDANAALIGGKYTWHSGVNLVAEFYSDALYDPVRRVALPGPRRNYGFLRVAKSRLRELPGWKEWDVAGSLIADLRTGTRIAVFDVSRRIRDNFTIYGRTEAAGRIKPRSEFAMIPYAALFSLGFRYEW